MAWANAWMKTREMWRRRGAISCITLGYLIAVHQILAATDAYEQVRSVLIEHEHFELDELVLLAALASPFACVALWIQTRRLRQETLQRRALDELMTELFKRVQEKDRRTW